MNIWIVYFVGLAVFSSPVLQAGNTPQRDLVVVLGAAGQDKYGEMFRKWAEFWETAGKTAGAKVLRIGPNSGAESQNDPPSGTENEREQLRQLLSDLPKDGFTELWLVFLGHGTFDGKEAKFNLRGPDVSGEDLGQWLSPFQRPLVVINCASASAPFINKLSAPGRIIVTATKSGFEQNFARFGEFFSQAVTDLEADLDKDDQVSILEAFLYASRRAEEFYTTAGRLSSEHALLDDNGDGLGTSADFFRGIRPAKNSAGGSSLDGFRAHQFHFIHSEQESKLSPAERARRNELETEIEQLRALKDQLAEEQYYAKLETILVELAQIYAQPGEKADLPQTLPAGAGTE